MGIRDKLRRKKKKEPYIEIINRSPLEKDVPEGHVKIIKRAPVREEVPDGHIEIINRGKLIEPEKEVKSGKVEILERGRFIEPVKEEEHMKPGEIKIINRGPILTEEDERKMYFFNNKHPRARMGRNAPPVKKGQIVFSKEVLPKLRRYGKEIWKEGREVVVGGVAVFRKGKWEITYLSPFESSKTTAVKASFPGNRPFYRLTHYAVDKYGPNVIARPVLFHTHPGKWIEQSAEDKRAVMEREQAIGSELGEIINIISEPGAKHMNVFFKGKKIDELYLK